MDQSRMQSLAHDHMARLLADAERDRLARSVRHTPRRSLADRLGTLLAAKRSAPHLGAEPC